MKLFRTEIIPKQIFSEKINWQNSFTSLGSCFADKVAQELKSKGIKICSNPTGVLYNPQSIADLIQNSLDLKEWTKSDCIDKQGVNILPYIQGEHPKPIDFIHQCQGDLHSHLETDQVLIITFGTAWAYHLRENDQVVANCHKLPKELFERRILSVNDISCSWSNLINQLSEANPKLQILFTVSPVRHLRDDFRENQISKSTLHLAIDEIIKTKENCFYFPSYEIMMDELRDYRFYSTDMTHPSDEATELIMDKFISSAFDDNSHKYFIEATKIKKLCSHKIHNPQSHENQKFIKIRNEKLLNFKKRYPSSSLTVDV
ncbi:GSCFA domain-containing protein [Lentisphaera marina]|uniref:GSCFA domain-containing protein n=1 Tax=Lentisphaera marina TaxID=1111041 RepID=UPI002366950F|nr:GSCFA domain-containing protein [Lentisphaera marina]MDD7984867.1 GSCFA domain-containing protein [Lentisphaera marina]